MAKDFQDCLTQFRQTLLKLIPVWYEKNYDPFVIKLSEDTIKDIEKGLKPKERLSFHQEKLKQAKELEMKEIVPIREEIKKIIVKLDKFSVKNVTPKFRYKFIHTDYKDKDNLLINGNKKIMATFVLTGFIAYIAQHYNKSYKQGDVREKVIEEMIVQENDYLKKHEALILLNSETEGKKIEGFEAFRNTQQSSAKETARFPTPSGAKWEDVEMYLTDEEHFEIKVKCSKRVASYSEMGFKHKTVIKKTELWCVLLKFATANNSAVKHYAKKDKVEKDIQRLNDVLINYFNISGNPIKYQSDKKGYEAEFKIYDKSYLKEHMNNTIRTISDKEKLDEEIDKEINNCNT